MITVDLALRTLPAMVDGRGFGHRLGLSVTLLMITMYLAVGSFPATVDGRGFSDRLSFSISLQRGKLLDLS